MALVKADTFPTNLARSLMKTDWHCMRVQGCCWIFLIFRLRRRRLSSQELYFLLGRSASVPRPGKTDILTESAVSVPP